MFFYSDITQPYSGPPIRFDRLNATKGYLRHYSNLLYLQFIVRESDKRTERQQATKELTICERKLSWWRRHPNINMTEVEKEVALLKRQWRANN